MTSSHKRYTDLNTYYRGLFGCRVQKISIDAGLSCPNRDGRISTGGCIYCNSRGSGTGAHARGLSVTEQILAAKTALTRRYKAQKFIAYFQSHTNTYAPLPTLERLYSEALAVKDVVGLSMGTRPDCVDEPILARLQESARDHLVWIEYGLQSAHDKTLERINRGHTMACFRQALSLTRNRGIRICAHVILGLPGETQRHMLETAETVAALNLDGLKLHLLYVVRGTPMETLYRNGGYTCLEQQAYADLVCDFLERLPPAMIIQRLTGDPHPDELVAPGWSLKKADTRNLIEQTLERRNSRQGRLWPDRGRPSPTA